MGATLILTNEGNRFEKLYYQAICMGELSAAERLYKQYTAAPTKAFWREAYQKSGLPETVLMSAIINHLDMPFGSYMFARRTDEVIEIVPWLYGDEQSKQALIDAVRKETSDVSALRAHARDLTLTADFIEWLAAYELHNTPKTEDAHGQS